MHQSPSRCPDCFQDTWSGSSCSKCGYHHDNDAFPSALPAGTTLSKYTLGRVLGRPGGFGITYLAFDSVLRRRVAIKELMPRDLVARRPDGATLYVHTRSDEGVFRSTLTSFLTEARVIAQFSHSHVVRVLDFFEGNGTAYFAMEYYQGETLAEQVTRAGGRLSGDAAAAVMLPILDALQHMHSLDEPLLHRDIKPQNIYLADHKRPILLDFGAARVALSRQSRSLSTVLTPGFAPYEQYSSRGNQGPWSDVYACAATMYYLVTGHAPPDAAERLGDPNVQPPSTLAPGLPVAIDQAIMAGLEFAPEGRPQSAVAFADLLTGRATRDEVAAVTKRVDATARASQASTRLASTAMAGSLGPTAHAPSAGDPRSATHAASPKRRLALMVSLAAAAVLLLAAGATWALRRGPEPERRAVGAAPTTAGQVDPIGRVDGAPLSAVANSGDLSGALPAKTPPRPGRPAPSAPVVLPPSVPRTAVLVVIYGEDAAGTRHAETLVLRSLVGRNGLRAMDATGLSLLRRNVDVMGAAGEGDFAALANAGKPYGLELIVVGTLSSRALPSVGQFYTGTAELDLKMYRASSGSLVEAETFRVGSGGEQAVLAITDGEARSRAAASAANVAAGAMTRWLNAAFPDSQ